MSQAQSEDRKSIYPQLKGFMGGVASGVAKLVVGHPFDTIKVRLQTEGYGGRFKGPIDCILQTIRQEGFMALYKGASAPLIGWTLIDSVMFASLSQFRNQFQKLNGDNTITMPQHFISGFGAGMVCSFVACPVELIKAKLQVQYADKSTQLYKGPVDCIRQIYRNNGITGYYQGLVGTLMFRTFISVYFGTYEYCKSKFASTQLPTQVSNFISGGIASIALWVVGFPSDVIKNRMQADSQIPRRYPTVKSCIDQIYKESGLKGFYRGFTPCLIRSFPTNGAALVAAELTMKYLS